MKWSSSIAAFAAALLATGTAAAAQNAPAVTPHLSLTPAVVVARGTFGQSLTQAVTLENGTPQRFAFRMEAQDVVVRNGRRAYVPAGQVPNSIAATAVFSQRSGSVDPMSSKTVLVRVTIPKTTNVRAITVTFRNTSVIATRGVVSFDASLSSLLTFTLGDDVELRADPLHVRGATASTNLKVAQRIANVGSEPIVPEGVAALIDANGTLAAKFNFATQRLLPGERATFTAEYGGTLKPGSYRVLATYQYEGKTLTSAGTYIQR